MFRDNKFLLGIIALGLIIFSMFFWNKQTTKETQKHIEGWGVYMKNLESGPIMVNVDIGFKNEAPLLDKLNLFTLRIKIKNPQQGGFPANEEFAILSKIEDDVDNFSASSTKTVSVAKTFDSGFRNIFLYTSDPNLKDSINSLMKPYGYIYTTNVQLDSNWNFYTQVLFPDAIAMRQIKNEQFVISLAKEGDDGSTPRKIDHWFYFSSLGQREKLKEELLKQDFVLDGEQTLSDSKGQPYQLHMSRTNKADISTINKLDSDLVNIAKKYSGDYDGYGSGLVKSTSTVNN